MRTVLLQAAKRTDTGELRAELMLGGRSVLAWQVDLALALGAQRIICLCAAPGTQVLALQRHVEAIGVEFHAIRSNLQLVSLVRADDDLIVLLDGLLIEQAAALGSAFSGEALCRGIATIPAGHSLAEAHPDDFERIDRDRHWAGLAVMRAGQVHKLADMPADGDAMSLLLRLGLQSRTECRDISGANLANQDWMLADDTNALAQREQALVEAGAVMPPWTGPARAAAMLVVRKIAPRWIESGEVVSALAACALIIGGLLLTVFGFGGAGLSVIGVGAFGCAISEAWGELKVRLWSKGMPDRARAAIPTGLDIAAAIGLVLVVAGPAMEAVSEITLAVLAIALAHYLGRENNDKAAAFWRDRTLHLFIFAIGAATGFLGAVLSVFALAAVAQLLFRRQTV